MRQAVVHASGRPKPITEKASLHDLLARLIRKFEGNESAYDFGKLSETYKYGLMAGIIGFEMEIEQLEANSTRPGTQRCRQGTQPAIGEAGPFHTRAHRRFLPARGS